MGAIQQQDHAEDCACDGCADARAHFAVAPDPELIHVGLPHLSDSRNGLIKAKAEDGLLCLTVEGFGRGELYMGKEAATSLRDQLNNALSAL